MNDFLQRLEAMNDAELAQVIGWKNARNWIALFRQAVTALVKHFESQPPHRQ